MLIEFKMPPKVKPAAKTKDAPKAAGVAKKKVTAKGYKKPAPVPNGEILTGMYVLLLVSTFYSISSQIILNIGIHLKLSLSRCVQATVENRAVNRFWRIR